MKDTETQTNNIFEPLFTTNSPVAKDRLFVRRTEGINGSHSKMITDSFGNNTYDLLASQESSHLHQHPIITSRFNGNAPQMSNAKDNSKNSFQMVTRIMKFKGNQSVN